MLFGKKKIRYIDRPLLGKCIPIDQVKDPVFAQKLMGEGFAVLPEEDVVCAPIAGKVTIAKTSHAFCITGEYNEEILVHIGIDTANLKGEGFQVLVQPDQYVEAGMPVLMFEKEAIAQKGYEICIIVVFSNYNEFELDTTILDKDKHILSYHVK